MQKYDLIKNAYRDIRTKSTGKIVRLYRLISLTELHPCGDLIIAPYTVGGWCESLDCLDDSHQDVWIAHDGKLFGGATIGQGTVIMDNAAVFGGAAVHKSRISGHAHIWGDVHVTSSDIGGNADITGNCKIVESTIADAVKIFESPEIYKSNISGGAIVRGTSKVRSCIISDVAEINGASDVVGSTFKGRAVISGEMLSNVTVNVDIELSVRNG